MAKAKSSRTKAVSKPDKGTVTITGTPTKGQTEWVWQQVMNGEPITAEQFALVAVWVFQNMPAEDRARAIVRLYELVHDAAKGARHE